MAYFSNFSYIKTIRHNSSIRGMYYVFVLIVAFTLSSCNSKEKLAEQVLVNVNGEEITVHQINDELKRASNTPGNQEASIELLLESLIDRQLILNEASRTKLDRSPEVMQAIEHAKSKIIAQAYLNYISSQIARPSKIEVEEYFHRHPEYFSNRKQFNLHQLVIPSEEINSELRMIIDSAKSIDTVTAWLDSHNIAYVRGQLSRSATDFSEQLLAKIMRLKNNQLLFIEEREYSFVNSLISVKNSPVTAKNATPKIEQYLMNKRIKEVADAELLHLRTLAKIQYNKPLLAASH